MTENEKNDFNRLLLKAERFCAYQERCSYEVKQKMKELGTDEKETEKIITSLKENGFLNDERFARLYASGKFRIKRWGKNKILAELRTKKIPDALIKQGLDALSKEEYLTTLTELAKKKEKEIKNSESSIKKKKIGNYLLSKGYESELIWQVLKIPPL